MSEFIVRCRRTSATTSSTVADESALVTLHHDAQTIGCSAAADIFTLALPDGKVIALRPGQVVIETDMNRVDGHEQDPTC